MDERPMRFCDICGQVDDHPRHVKMLEGGSTEGEPSTDLTGKMTYDLNTVSFDAVRQFLSGEVQVHHMDCGATSGCEVCIGTEAEYGARRGQELIDHLEEVRNG